MNLFILKYGRALQRAIVMLGFIFLCIIFICTFPNITKSNDTKHTVTDSALIADIMLFEEALVDRQTYDSIRRTEWKQKNIARYDSIKKARYENYQSQIHIQAASFLFDPNTLDSIGFVKLGFRPHIARSIIKYRTNGGRFIKPSDLKKIYYIDTTRVNDLIAFIQIDSTNIRSSDKTTKDLPTEKIELNSADSTALMALPHIARYRAFQILRYRRSIGGFYNISQIAEACPNLTSQQITEIAKYASIDPKKIKSIPINRSSVERLKAHPYINFYQAKAIYELRWELGGKLDSISQITSLKDINDSVLNRLKPYLSFE